MADLAGTENQKREATKNTHKTTQPITSNAERE